MKEGRIPNQVIQGADNFSKETGISFRDCLEVLYKAYLAGDNTKRQVVRPEYTILGCTTPN